MFHCFETCRLTRGCCSPPRWRRAWRESSVHANAKPMEYVTGAGWRRQEEAANVRGYQLSPIGGGPRTEYVTRARRRREAEAQERATQEREEGPAKKIFGGEHIGNQREQAANVVRKHILNGGVAEGERHWAYPEKRWPLKLDGIIQQKQQGAMASQAGFQGAFMASSFRPQESDRNPDSSRLRDHQHRLDRAAELSAKLGVDKVKLFTPSIIDTTPQAGHHTAAAPAESVRQSHRHQLSMRRDAQWPTSMDYFEYDGRVSQRGAAESFPPKRWRDRSPRTPDLVA